MTGMRKVGFGGFCFTLLWIAYMWAPDISDVARGSILDVMAIVVGAVIVGNGFVHFTKRKDKTT